MSMTIRANDLTIIHRGWGIGIEREPAGEFDPGDSDNGALAQSCGQHCPRAERSAAV